jgi:hypothetical protein
MAKLAPSSESTEAVAERESSSPGAIAVSFGLNAERPDGTGGGTGEKSTANDASPPATIARSGSEDSRAPQVPAAEKSAEKRRIAAPGFIRALPG